MHRKENDMNLEKIKRVPLISFLYRIFHIGYGTCGVCGLPWSNCSKHIVKMTEYDEFFPVCEYCWEHASITQIKQACTKLYYTWESQGITPYTIDEMHQAIDRLQAQKGE